MVSVEKKYLPLTDALVDYVEESRTHEGDELLTELRVASAQFGDDAIMQIPDHQGTFMTILARLVGAKSALEIGTFTGHSSICIARGLPVDGRLICLDMSKEWTDVAREFWEKDGLSEKIELRMGDALDSIAKFNSDESFDFVHIDAEKLYYDQFYEAVLPFVRSGGVIIFDNMLKGGAVIQPTASERIEEVKKLNAKLAKDDRVECVLITMGDGIQMCRKK